jgi:glycosyltransferase involved in cell wall biosynthesis
MVGAKGNVCIVRHSFYPWELNVKREAEALLEEGYGVHVVCLRDPGEAPRETVDGVVVHRVPVGHERGRILRYLFEYTAFFWLASFKLLGLHVRHRFRAVQVNTMPDYLVFAALGPRLAGARVVLHMHEPVPELFATMFSGWYAGVFTTLARWAERASLAFADRVLTVTREMRDNFGLRGADVNKITVIVNVPDDRLFRMDRYPDLADRVAALKKDERRRGVFRVLTHGAIEERYGQDVIVRAVARLKNEIPGIRFRFMGRGSYVESVLALARELRVDEHVEYLGFVSIEEMIGEILAADVTVVSQKSNPYSNLVHTNKMYEYVALERPVVASRLRSTAAYFGDEAILFYESTDDADLADRLREVYAHPEEVAARVEAATHVYETYRWSREKRKYLGVYAELLD